MSAEWAPTMTGTAIISERSYHGGGGDVVVSVEFRFTRPFFLDDRQYARLGTVRTFTTSIPLIATSERLERQGDQHPTHRFTEPEIGRVCGTIT